MSVGPSLDSELTHVSECRSCKADIVWGVMERSGKRNPLDRAPDPDGRIIVEAWQATERGMAPVVRVLHDDELELVSGPRYTSHFATCPDAQQHRRR